MLSLFSAVDLLKRYSSNLVGCHLHDASGLDDHLPPGRGEIDFPALATFLPPGLPQVIELKPKTPPEAARDGATHLAAALASVASDQ